MTCIALAGCSIRSLEYNDQDASAVSIIDAAPDAVADADVTLRETISDQISPASSISCTDGNSRSPGSTWFRAFRLASFGIDGPIHVAAIQFGTQESQGTPSLHISVGAYAGPINGPTLALAMITPIADTFITVPNTTSGETLTAPIDADVAAGGTIVVSVTAPDQTQAQQGYYFIGATTSGENAPGYYMSAPCNTPAPITTVAGGGPGAILISVVGMLR